MTDGEGLAVRRLRASDARALLTAFTSAPDMPRQGDVSTLREAERYVAHLLGTDASHEAWAVAEDDQLIGLVAVTVDQVNRNGWFWY